MGEVVHHEGETAGYRTYIAFDPARKTGIVLLANAHTQVDLGDVGDSIPDRDTAVVERFLECTPPSRSQLI